MNSPLPDGDRRPAVDGYLRGKTPLGLRRLPRKRHDGHRPPLQMKGCDGCHGGKTSAGQGLASRPIQTGLPFSSLEAMQELRRLPLRKAGTENWLVLRGDAGQGLVMRIGGFRDSFGGEEHAGLGFYQGLSPVTFGRRSRIGRCVRFIPLSLGRIRRGTAMACRFITRLAGCRCTRGRARWCLTGVRWISFLIRCTRPARE